MIRARPTASPRIGRRTAAPGASLRQRRPSCGPRRDVTGRRLGGRRFRCYRSGRLAAKADLPGECRARRGVGRCYHRVVLGQAPAAPIVLGRHVVPGGQMPLEHLEFLAVFQADDEILLDRLLDRHRRHRCIGGLLGLGLTHSAQGLKHASDQGRNITHRYGIVADKRADDLGGQRQKLLRLAVIIHSVGLSDPSYRLASRCHAGSTDGKSRQSEILVNTTELLETLRVREVPVYGDRTIAS